MKRTVTLLAVLPLLTALCSFGSVRQHKMSAHGARAQKMSAENQFHFHPTKGRGVEILARERAGEHKQAPIPGRLTQLERGVHMAAQTRVKPRRNLNPPVSQIGFVSAMQIPAGGYLAGQNVTLSGDFDGDGNLDLVSLVGDPNGSGTYSLAVVLSQGNGTFLAPVLTPTPGNQSDPFVVGDVNGDGLDDIIIAHQPGTNGNAEASFDVLLSNGDGTFAVGNNYSITGNFLSGGTLSVDATTGFLDVVVVDSANPGNVWTVTGNGDGTFSDTPTSVALNAQVGYDAVLADLNNDGLLDVTSNDSNTGQQTVFLATSPTLYAAGVPYTTPDGVYDACSTTVGDLTSDGFPEIVNANCSDNTITIYVNNGDGTYATGAYYNAAANGYVYPEAVTIADVNGDGLPDIVSSNDDSSDVTILLGNGDGTVVSPALGYTRGGSFLSNPAIVADFNGDGLPDIIVPDDLYSLSYMKGYGDGSFRAGVDYYSPSSDGGEPMGFDIATGDFNGDGFADVVVGNCCDTGGITVFLSRADGSMQPGVNYGSGGGLLFVAVADFDGDGKLDIAATDYYNGVVQIFKGVGDGTFTLGGSYPTDAASSSPMEVVAADFNGDGFPDLAVANSAGSNVGVLLNDGTGDFSALANYPTCSSSVAITAADLNGDGFPDLLVPLPSCTGMAVLLNMGDGTGTFNPETDFGVGNNPQQVAVGDLNGDGIPDLAITLDGGALNSQGIGVALGNGDGTFQPVNVPPYPTTLQPNYRQPYPGDIRLVDLDGDGNLDLVYNNTNFGTVGVMYGIGDGTFYDPVEYPVGVNIYGLALGDLNGDGAVDVVTAGFYTSGVTTLINNSGTKALPDYSVSANPASTTITAGASGAFTITLTPRNFYNGTVTFSCGTLPSEATCTFSNPSLTPNGNGVLTSVLTIKTTAPSSALMAPMDVTPHGGAPSLLASLAGVGLFGLILAGEWKKNGRRMGIILALVALGMLVTLVGCGGSSTPPIKDPGTPPGTYTVTVTASGTAGNNNGNTSAHTLTLTLTVQP